MEMENKITYPWVIFKLNGRDYCISSSYISTMAIPTAIQKVPMTPGYVMGIFNLIGEIVTVIDMRSLLKMPSLDTELEHFATMKQMHIDWVETLDTSFREKREFTLNRNPHKCSFGEWYDSYKTDNNAIKFILKKIHDPHEELHSLADEVEKYRESDPQKAEKILSYADQLCKGTIIPLLENLIDAYRDANKGILIVLEVEAQKIAVLVDEITAVSYLTDMTEHNPNSMTDNVSGYVKSIISSGGRAFFNVDVEALIKMS